MENVEELVYLAVSNGEWMDEKTLHLIKSKLLFEKKLSKWRFSKYYGLSKLRC